MSRNGQAFHPILDYLRTSKLFTHGLSLKSILVEANYYSINLAFAFCGISCIMSDCSQVEGNLQEGLYSCESIHGAEILYVERDKNIPWNFGITGMHIVNFILLIYFDLLIHSLFSRFFFFPFPFSYL
jgi:hypothetical protein